MPLPAYANNGPVDCSVKPETGTLKGKSVVVTGGEHQLYHLRKPVPRALLMVFYQVLTALARVMFAHSLPPGEFAFVVTSRLSSPVR
jgi:hypothetical protein